MSEEITPGTCATIHGIDVVAVSHGDQSYSYDCTFHQQTLQCPFDDHRCGSVGCNGVIWLTVPDYVIYRLKS